MPEQGEQGKCKRRTTGAECVPRLVVGVGFLCIRWGEVFDVIQDCLRCVGCAKLFRLDRDGAGEVVVVDRV